MGFTNLLSTSLSCSPLCWCVSQDNQCPFQDAHKPTPAACDYAMQCGKGVQISSGNSTDFVWIIQEGPIELQDHSRHERGRTRQDERAASEDGAVCTAAASEDGERGPQGMAHGSPPDRDKGKQMPYFPILDRKKACKTFMAAP